MLIDIAVDDILDEAHHLAEGHGLSVIPIRPNDKVSAIAWKPYQEKRATSEELEGWFAKEKYNVGIVTGKISRLVVLDVDNLDELRNYPDLPKTPTATTGKGKHFYFKHPDGVEVEGFNIKGLGDVRAKGGYVVAPPSFHANGKRYEWEVHPDDVALAELPDWLLKRCEEHTNRRKSNGVACHSVHADVQEDTSYGKAWFADVEKLARAVSGERNNLLNVVACKAGSLIAGGQLTEATATTAMVKACKTNGLNSEGPSSVLKTIKSGIERGLKKPRCPDIDVEVSGRKVSPMGGLRLVAASAIEPEKIEWLWPGVLAKGAFSLLAGEPGQGKSQVSLSIAAAITTGGHWPASTEKAPIGNVIILALEDRAEDTIIPRLMACGADRDRVFLIDDGDENIALEVHAEELRQLIEETGNVSLVIIDPISAYLGKGDGNNTSDVRRITNQLARTAQQLGCCVLGLSHLNKGGGQSAKPQSALHRVQGSVSWTGAARTAFLIDREGTSDVRTMTSIKNNLSVDTLGYAFTVRARTVKDGIEAPYVVWENRSFTKTADQVLEEKQEDRSAKEEAEAFLKARLENGKTAYATLKAEAEKLGISRSTLYRAKDKLRLQGLTEEGETYWALPVQ